MENVQFQAGLYLPQFAGTEALPMIEQAWARMDVLIPIALFSTLGSLVVVEAARAIGDQVSMKGALTVNGVGSIAAGLLLQSPCSVSPAALHSLPAGCL